MNRDEVQNNYTILTNLYEEKREEIDKLKNNITTQANSILQLRSIEAKYNGNHPNSSQFTQTYPSLEDEGVQASLEFDSEDSSAIRKEN